MGLQVQHLCYQLRVAITESATGVVLALALNTAEEEGLVPAFASVVEEPVEVLEVRIKEHTVAGEEVVAAWEVG